MKSEEEIIKWWNELSDWWKITFKQYIFHITRQESIEKTNKISVDEIRLIFELESMNLWGDDNIEPLRFLTKLKRIICLSNDMNISTIDVLKELPRLETVNIVGTKVSDLSPLRNAQNLKELYCFRTQVKTIKPIMQLDKLELLWIGSQAPYNEIKEFAKLHPNCKINPKSNY